jgi:hypothetical protein
MDSQEKDRFASLVDAAFSDELGCLQGDVSCHSFSVPLEYRAYSALLPCDKEVQEKVLTLYREAARQLGLDQDQGGEQDQGGSRVRSVSVGASSVKRSGSGSSGEWRSGETPLQDHPFGDIFAIRTTGDGDCLLHALSLCMWGREDHFRLLRGLLSLAFSNPELSSQLEEMFVEEERQRDEELGFAGAREEKLLREEYANAASRAFSVGTYLEGIHISCLSHILRRPIVVLDGEDGQRISSASLKKSSHVGSPDGPNSPFTEVTASSGESMAGIYLPVLHSLSSSNGTSKSPLVIVYTTSCTQVPEFPVPVEIAGDGFSVDSAYPSYVGHFTALVGCDSIKLSSKSIDATRAIPLVTTSSNSGHVPLSDQCSRDVTLSSMRVRYCMSSKHNIRCSEDKEVINKELIHKHLDVEFAEKCSQYGYGSIYLAKQCLTLAPEGTEIGENSPTRGVPNCLLSSTSHHRRLDFLDRVLCDQEDESRRLRKRLDELKHGIRRTEHDKAECESFLAQTSLQEKRSLRHWRKHGEALVDPEKSPSRKYKSKHSNGLSPSSASSGHSFNHTSPSHKSRSGNFSRTESNESNDSNETGESKGSRGSRSVKSSSRRHRESSEKLRSRTSAGSLETYPEEDKIRRHHQSPRASNSSTGRSVLLDDLIRRDEEQEYRAIEERQVQRAMEESLRELEVKPQGTCSISLPTTTSATTTPSQTVATRSVSSDTSNSLADNSPVRGSYGLMDSSGGDFGTPERYSSAISHGSTGVTTGERVESMTNAYRSSRAGDDHYTKSIVDRIKTGTGNESENFHSAGSRHTSDTVKSLIGKYGKPGEDTGGGSNLASARMSRATPVSSPSAASSPASYDRRYRSSITSRDNPNSPASHNSPSTARLSSSSVPSNRSFRMSNRATQRELDEAWN